MSELTDDLTDLQFTPRHLLTDLNTVKERLFEAVEFYLEAPLVFDREDDPNLMPDFDEWVQVWVLTTWDGFNELDREALIRYAYAVKNNLDKNWN